MISKKLLSILKVCFWLNILVFITIIIFDVLQFSEIMRESSMTLSIVISIFCLAIFFLFGYTIYFFYKYDKYSKSGIYFLLFHLFYAHIYFYKVIWKRKRKLINSYEREKVIGNTIFIETEESD